MIVWSNPAPGLNGAGLTNFASFIGGVQRFDILIAPNDDTIDTGNPTIITTPAGFTPSNGPAIFSHKYHIFINGTERTTQIRAGQPDGPGIVISKQIGSRDTCDITSFDTAATYAPSRGDEILVYEDTLLIFNGFVDRVKQYTNLGDPILYGDIHCVDAGVMFDRRVVGKDYTLSLGGLVGIIAGDIVNTYMAGLGLTYRYTFAASAVIPGVGNDIKFTYITCTEAMNQLARIANANWRVDENRVVYFFQIGGLGGTTTAPANFTNVANKNWVTAALSTTSVNFANSVVVKSNINLAALWTDTEPGNASGVYPTTYGLFSRPIVTVNGVQQLVKSSDELAAEVQPFDFYYINDGIGVFMNPSLTPLTGADTVEITYPSTLPYVAVAQDALSIAAVGLYQAIIDGGDISDKTQLQGIADAALAKAEVVPLEVTIVTRQSGFSPGQLFHATMSPPAGPSMDSDFVITGVNSRLIANSFMEHTITATSEQPQRPSSPALYMGTVIARTRTPEDRVVQRIAFVVAGTIEGLTNPGLTTGVKTAIYQAQKPGVAGWCSLQFNSANNGTLTTTDVIIDVLQNGVTIFGSTKMVFPAGSIGLEYQYQFATDPLIVNPGDTFTFDVAAADPLAMDGSLELVILG